MRNFRKFLLNFSNHSQFLLFLLISDFLLKVVELLNLFSYFDKDWFKILGFLFVFIFSLFSSVIVKLFMTLKHLAVNLWAPVGILIDMNGHEKCLLDGCIIKLLFVSSEQSLDDFEEIASRDVLWEDLMQVQVAASIGMWFSAVSAKLIAYLSLQLFCKAHKQVVAFLLKIELFKIS